MIFVDAQNSKSGLSIMKNFAIADLERFSGIKAHTLRTWEHRYGIPKPLRNNKNRRYYSLGELKQILLIALLNRYGFKISQLSLLSEDEILHRLNSIDDEECHFQTAVNRLLFNMYAMDTPSYEKVLDYCFLNWPTHKVISNVIDPFLKLTGLVWQGNRLAEEHLVVTILRKKLHYSIEQLPISTKTKSSVLLFLNDSRQLDLSLLHACYILKYSGVDVIYMGNDVTIDNLSVVLDTFQPKFLYTYLPDKNSFQFEKLIAIMDKKLPNGKLMVTPQPEKISKQCTISHKIFVANFDDAMKIMCDK